MKDTYYAHSREGKPPEDWQRLDDHLKNVAEMARGFAEDFGAGGDWGYLTGLWQDLAQTTSSVAWNLIGKARTGTNG
jgi:CRISPR-associated endonuclease/helicase Cas3